MIEKNFDISFIADMALREKQIQQNYRPVIAVHKWFARRPGTLFRGLLLSEFSDRALCESFYDSNCFPGIHVADPFMGGGTPVLEANRLGCDVTGFDINPMAYWIVKQEIDRLDFEAYEDGAADLLNKLEAEVGHLYRTRCLLCDSENAHAKYFLWVKTEKCRKCEKENDLFPGYIVAVDSRHPKNVFVCASCGNLTETGDRKNPGTCSYCAKSLQVEGPAKRGRFKCFCCGTENVFPGGNPGEPNHRLFALEYHCPACKPGHTGRFFKTPDSLDYEKEKEAEKRLKKLKPVFVPEDEIPRGDETGRLHRWGYKRYRQMFNFRQLLSLEYSARIIDGMKDDVVRNALATNLSDLLRYQNMLCRYDKKALKSLDVFSVHGFPVGLIQCESNILGIKDPGRNTCIGSGGWANIIEKYKRAKAYCENPFEVIHESGKKRTISIANEWIGNGVNRSKNKYRRSVKLYCKDAASAQLEENSLDGVFTDPPYFGNVQYAELMDFCYVWLKRLAGRTSRWFDAVSTRNACELTGNVEMGRNLNHFAEGLSAVYQRVARAMKPGAPLVFTYHHNKLDAYHPVIGAILDAGLTCTASFPCPAEMGASIHINGTGSSIIDTVFVCRSTGTVRKSLLADSPSGVERIVIRDLAELRAGNVKPTKGDIRCIVFGHLARLAVWHLRSEWDKDKPIKSRMTKIANWLGLFESGVNTLTLIDEDGKNEDGTADLSDMPLFAMRENVNKYESENTEVSF